MNTCQQLLDIVKANEDDTTITIPPDDTTLELEQSPIGWEHV